MGDKDINAVKVIATTLMMEWSVAIGQAHLLQDSGETQDLKAASLSLLCGRYHALHIAYRISNIAYHISQIKYCISNIAYQILHIEYCISIIAYQVLQIQYHILNIAYQISHNKCCIMTIMANQALNIVT